MRRFFFLAACLTLALSPASAEPQQPGSSLSGPPAFKFGKVDQKLLAEANAVDQHLENEGLVYSDPTAERELKEIASPLLSDCERLEGVTWHFRVLRDPLVNAFSLPNGSVYINSGILGMVENRAQLASILAHEIMHVRNRHAYLSFRSYRKKALAGNIVALGAVAGGVAWPRAAPTIWSIAAASQVLLAYSIYGYSRELEREADMGAVDLLERTSLDTRQFPRLFQLLREQSEPPPVRIFLSDHPALAEREKYIEAAIVAQPSQGRDGAESGEYLAAFSKAILDDVQREIDARRFRTAVLRAGRLADWRAEGPHYYWLAEAYRNLGPRSQDPAPAEASKEPLARLQLTVSDENQLLARQTEGKERLRESESKAEAAYQRAIALGFGPAYRGIGLLYQRQSKLTEARDAYVKYIEIVPDASDRIAIQRRIAELSNK